MTKTIVYQGEPGANSHIACELFDKKLKSVACGTFDQAFNEIINGNNDFGMIPVENSIAGRVADIHRLMPTSGLKIVGELFLEIQHTLMGTKESNLDSLMTVRSHEMALSQCRDSIEKLQLVPHVAADTAGSAREVSELNNKTIGAIASPLAAEIYNLKILKENNKVFTFSIHGEKNYPFHKENSNLDIPVKDGITGFEYLKKLKENLDFLSSELSPDIIFYISGVDILDTDKLGRLAVKREDCKKRDEMVFEFSKKCKAPIVTVMGGGYSEKIYDIVEAHCNTFKSMLSLF